MTLMKRKRFTDEQITHALRQAEGDMPVVEVCRKMQISEGDVLLVEEEVRGAWHR